MLLLTHFKVLTSRTMLVQGQNNTNASNREKVSQKIRLVGVCWLGFLKTNVSRHLH